MPDCRICNSKLQKNWKYCPHCGGKQTEDEYSFVKLNYIWERERSGQFIYDNFRAVRDTGNAAFKKTNPIRKQLGDLVHINFYNLRKYALLSFSPNLTLELFKIGRLTGYYDSVLSLDSIGMKSRSDELSKTEKFLAILNEIDKEGEYTTGFINLGCGILELKRIDDINRKVVYTLDEDTNYPANSSKKVCYEELGTFCGEVEGITGRFFSGRETKCHCAGDNICEFEIYQTRREEEPQIELLTKEEAAGILDNIVNDLVHRRSIVNRKTLGDYTYMAYDQSMNYILTHSSKGHEVLTRCCGGQIGERIAKEAGLDNDVGETVDYFRDLFEYLKVGLLQVDSKTDDELRLRIDESVYSSGVKNINMKLDTFTAGIIEGALKKTTNQKWSVDETKCLANGDKRCEFTCKIR